MLHGPTPDIPISFSGEFANPFTHIEMSKAPSSSKMQ